MSKTHHQLVHFMLALAYMSVSLGQNEQFAAYLVAICYFWLAVSE